MFINNFSHHRLDTARNTIGRIGATAQCLRRPTEEARHIPKHSRDTSLDGLCSLHFLSHVRLPLISILQKGDNNQLPFVCRLGEESSYPPRVLEARVCDGRELALGALSTLEFELFDALGPKYFRLCDDLSDLGVRHVLA